MKIIVGLGNPGTEYETTFHNIGFAVVDKLRSIWDFPPWKEDTKSESVVSSGKIGKEKILLAKPFTFMNNSGRAVSKLVAYYKVKPADIIVIHDEFDLPMSAVRSAFNRGSAGHKGVQSVINSIGTKSFARIRIGISIGGAKGLAGSFVLSKMSNKEKKELDKTVSKIELMIKNLISTKN